MILLLAFLYYSAWGEVNEQAFDIFRFFSTWELIIETAFLFFIFFGGKLFKKIDF